MASRYLQGRKINPEPITGGMTVADLIDNNMQAYNGARLREAAMLLTQKCLKPDVTVGVTLTGALTPAGLGISALIPMMRAGFIDWIISTGANLYHDTHFGIGLDLRQGSPTISDVVLREENVVRIYDIFFDYDVLLKTDAFFRKIFESPEFQKPMGSAEFHYLCGKYIAEREKALNQEKQSILSVAYELGIPIYTSSPGDSSIGMNMAARQLSGSKLTIDPLIDVNETAAIVLSAKRNGGESAICIFGGGSPKNFALQTEPQIQEVLGIEEKGHDYFLQVTDARPDTGGLSGATPSEAVSWGKVDPDKLPGTVVCYADSTIVLPLLAAYALTRAEPREQKRLYDKRHSMMDLLRSEYEKAQEHSGEEE